LDEVSKDLAGHVSEILSEIGFSYRERIFSPLVTLYGFLSQIFNDDSSCRHAVMELSRIRTVHRKRRCSMSTGSFCKAKKRLPLVLIKGLVKRIAETLTVGESWAWRHGRVFVVDGTGFSMPDTKENAAVFVRHGSKTHKKSVQKKSNDQNVAFPVGRVLGIFSLTTGALLDLAISTWKGKGTGELSLLKQITSLLKENDTLLGDAIFSSYGVLASSIGKGCHVVSELKKASYHRIKTSRSDQIITLLKPKQSAMSLSLDDYNSLANQITVRIVKITCAPAGFRPKVKFIITTHTNVNQVSAADLAELYQRRWQVELNFRSIKTVLGMDIVSSKTPEMVHKEVWMHMLAYNVIRTAMCEVAAIKTCPVTSISFRATQQIMRIDRLLKACGIALKAESLFESLMHEQVGKRPGRFEPRVIKRRPKGYKLMTEPRNVSKTKLHKKSKK
jgi:IS4 transposase